MQLPTAALEAGFFAPPAGWHRRCRLHTGKVVPKLEGVATIRAVSGCPKTFPVAAFPAPCRSGHRAMSPVHLKLLLCRPIGKELLNAAVCHFRLPWRWSSLSCPSAMAELRAVIGAVSDCQGTSKDVRRQSETALVAAAPIRDLFAGGG